MEPHEDRPVRREPHRFQRWKYQMLWQPVRFTVCVSGQRSVLTRPGVPGLIAGTLQDAAAAHGCALVAYCIMPEHLHVLACVVEEGGDLVSFVETFKQTTGYSLSQEGARAPVWQRGFWDRHVRDSDDLAKAIQYILDNPVRRGLCARPEDWPYARFCGYPWEDSRRG